MEKKEKQQPQPESEVTLEQITKECLDSPGYVILTGILSRTKDKHGFSFINSKYRRYNFSYEDTKIAIAENIKAYLKDNENETKEDVIAFLKKAL